jgi:hypothetical protein
MLAVIKLKIVWFKLLRVVDCEKLYIIFMQIDNIQYFDQFFFI